MTNQPYSEHSGEQLTLRDKLAISRTVLANERTLLAYFRTALAFLIAGASLIKFFDSIILEIFGYSLLPIGLGFVLVGIKRFKKMDPDRLSK
jgi:putative membrane protein